MEDFQTRQDLSEERDIRIEPIDTPTVGARIAFSVGVITAWTLFLLLFIVVLLSWTLQAK